MSNQVRRGKHVDIISKKCHKCGHDKFFSRQSGLRCSRCRAKPSKIEMYKNKNNKMRPRVVVE